MRNKNTGWQSRKEFNTINFISRYVNISIMWVALQFSYTFPVGSFCIQHSVKKLCLSSVFWLPVCNDFTHLKDSSKKKVLRERAGKKGRKEDMNKIPNHDSVFDIF